MRIFHKHKWEYLGKEYHVKQKHKFSSIGYIGGSSEDEEINVTTIRFFCKSCTEIKSHTVEGNIKATEVMKMGMLGESDE